MKISEALDSIHKRDLVLPEFQREYVWGREQAKQLLVSLMKDYPVGSLLFWKTDQPPDLKNVAKLPEKLGTIQLILDGQQRLTTLHLLMLGGIPPYYREVDLQTDPRDLYFHLGEGEFQYYQLSRMKEDPLWGDSRSGVQGPFAPHLSPVRPVQERVRPRQPPASEGCE